MCGNSSHGNREIPASSIPWVDRLEKATSRTSRMHEVGKSDDLVVPGKRANKGRRPAESVEGRGSAKGNGRRGATPRTQSRIGVSLLASRVREVASAASPPQPEVGAGCGSSARPDLSGGLPVRAVPTGTYLVGGGDVPSARSGSLGFPDGLHGRSCPRAHHAVVVDPTK